MRIFIIFFLLYVLNTMIIDFPNTDAFSSPNSIGNETDRLALLDIKSKITLDPHGVLSSWNDSGDFCLWEGVTCNVRDKRVIKLNLTAKGLVGTLSPFIGNLSFLQTLKLNNNTFKGLIPPQIGRLSSLHELYLQFNEFEGEIPANISGCLQLTYLALVANNLSGYIPSELGHLSRLQNLGLTHNSFTGTISPLSNLTSLRILSLSTQTDQGGPGFQGTIPDFLGNFKDLTYLALGGNSFTGKIPPSLYNLSKLETFSLSENLLEGSLPPNLGFSFPQLKWLQLRNNHFSGPIPSSLSNLSNLELLELGNNSFTGKFLLDGRNMKNLTRLHLNTAKLGTGEADDLNFLSSLVNCSRLLTIDIQENYFGGVLPQSIVNLSPKLLALLVNDNQISGSIPSNWSNYLSLRLLRLDNNHFTGSIPTEIGQIPMLQEANFSNNQLSGSIPLSLGNLSWLSNLDLSRNKIQGTIPATLGNCTSLQVLDLSSNNLFGHVPHQLFQASTLIALDYSNNHLQGSLPSNMSELENLMYVNMGNNNFSGNIPDSLGQCLGLTYLYLNGNSFIGPIPSSFSLLKGLQEIDLSNNRLSGQVPGYFSNFSSLVLLNLSFNNFEGEIPTNGVFSNHSVISLAGNSALCGGIPQLKLPSCPKTESYKRKKSHHAIIIMVVSICCALTGLAIVSFVYLRQRRIRKATSSSRVQFKEPFMKVSYDMIHKATNGFSARNLIGSGSFGSVYKGTLLLDGVEKAVAIKVIKIQRRGAKKSFIAECKALRIIRHRNLVGVITACSSIDFQGNEFEALVYEFMPKGSLERWLYLDSEDDDQLQSLSLLQRLNIAIDVAHAVDYIHNGNDPPIIHCDLKPTNILLDEDMTAHVGDFGLVKLLPEEVSEQLQNSSSIGVRGTVGYAAPEYGLGTSISVAGDVYSYGIILLEMMTAKNPTNTMFEGDMSLHKLAESALPDRVLEIIDPKLTIDNDVDNEEERNKNLNETMGIPECALECITTLIMTGVRCSSELPQDRLDMKDVIRQLLCKYEV